MEVKMRNWKQKKQHGSKKCPEGMQGSQRAGKCFHEEGHWEQRGTTGIGGTKRWNCMKNWCVGKRSFLW